MDGLLGMQNGDYTVLSYWSKKLQILKMKLKQKKLEIPGISGSICGVRKNEHFWRSDLPFLLQNDIMGSFIPT